jgi:hypothetical protein
MSEYVLNLVIKNDFNIVYEAVQFASDILKTNKTIIL